jgi:hypothetical protein
VAGSLSPVAAFRLFFLSLLRHDQAGADRWTTWLRATYPDAPITDALGVFLANWHGTNDGGLSCTAFMTYLKKRDMPVGALYDTGYANPRLHPEDVCDVTVLAKLQPDRPAPLRLPD